MVKLAKLNGVWYVIDFGQKQYWSVTSSSQLTWLRDEIKLPVAPDNTTAVISGYERIAA